jgi:hypothetical protein
LLQSNRKKIEKNTLVLFPVSGYLRAVAMGALDVYGYYTRDRKDLPTNTAIWTYFHVLFHV